VGWDNVDNGEGHYKTLNGFLTLQKYYNTELMQVVDRSEIEDSPKEVFIDFGGEFSKFGKTII
jgi:hypothetical protein